MHKSLKNNHRNGAYYLGIFFFCSILLGALACNSNKEVNTGTTSYTNWKEYLGGADRNHYSKLVQIDTVNVDQLEPIWEYHTGDLGEMQCNPLIVSGILYGTTAACEAFALDAETGKEKWRYKTVGDKKFLKSRGVSYWEDESDKRILYTYGEWLYALDANTGTPIPTFGEDGRISLKAGLDKDSETKYVMSRTPGSVYKNLIIMPLVVGESYGAASGYIQAFHIKTGELAWVFRTIPRKQEEGYETWPEQMDRQNLIGGANSWAGMAVDTERGIVFAPTGSAAFDFYGGDRKGKNLYANSLLALNASTGEKIWHYQIVHHDIWDKDLPSPPNLVTLKMDGKRIDAVAQITKTGHVFMFERETGVPIFPIEEKAFPSSNIPGEETWPTQPIPTLPKPFSRQGLTEKDINPLSPDYDSLLVLFKKAYKGYYHPLDETSTIVFPGCDGGAEWGGAAVDRNGVMYVNSNEMAWVLSLSENKKQELPTYTSIGEKVYSINCIACHKKDLTGMPQSGFPSLVNIGEKLNRQSIENIIANGQGMMPGFTQISQSERQALLAFLLHEKKTEAIDAIENIPDKKLPKWKFNGYDKFLDSEGNPGIKPPWGQLTAIDLNTGKHLWQIPLGETNHTKEGEFRSTGTENYGGPLVTEGGLLIIAATKDEKLRAFNKTNGKLLWEVKLPASAFATPSTYEIDRQQYIVIACGGGKLGTSKGDSYIAFKLPTNPEQ